MLAVLLFGKKYETSFHASNGELPKIMQVLDLKPWSPVYWRSKSCKTISLTGVYFFYLTKARPRGTLIAATVNFSLGIIFWLPSNPCKFYEQGKNFRKVWIYLTRLSCLFGNFWKCWSIDYRKLSKIQTGNSGCVGSQRTLSWAKAFLSDVRQSEVDFLHSWASSLRENTVAAQMW